ncbi:MAG TPA: hypothetical protein VGC86_15755 [Afipia sp.]
MSGWSAWLKATALLTASSAVLAALSMHVRPDTEIVAAIFPPWWSARHAVLAVAEADAMLVRGGAIPAIVIVKPARDDGLKKLRSAGAWFAVDPQAVAACFSNTTANKI